MLFIWHYKVIGSEQGQSIRSQAKKLIKSREQQYIDGRLGLVIDGTGKDYPKIAKQKNRLQKVGYDCFMIFVNTDLDVALERNKKRDRTLPEKLVKDAWNGVQNNLGKFQALFGASNMLIVDNSEFKDFPAVVKKSANEFMSRKIQNPIAKAWIKKEKELRNKK